mgnify:CR=1 FL=1
MSANDAVQTAFYKHGDVIEVLVERLGFNFYDVVFLVEEAGDGGDSEMLWRAYFREDEAYNLDEDHLMGEGPSPDKALRASIADLRDRLDEEDEEDEKDEDEDEDDEDDDE